MKRLRRKLLRGLRERAHLFDRGGEGRAGVVGVRGLAQPRQRSRRIGTGRDLRQHTHDGVVARAAALVYVAVALDEIAALGNLDGERVVARRDLAYEAQPVVEEGLLRLEAQ